LIAFRAGTLAIDILDGDIAAQEVDAVVNAANNAFWMGSGVAGALQARGGASIEREAMALGPVAPGECVVTAAGRLPARFVVHAAVMGQDLRTSADLIRRATANALAAADQRGCLTVAFPAFGTGVGGFPVGECAQIMIGVVRTAPRHAVARVRFVLFGQPAYRAFCEVAGEMLGPPVDGPPDCPIST
jgi:O-acetyl-ADP-ribose deacetylase (regulator of RNase III)